MENSGSLEIILALSTLAAVVSTLIVGLYAQWKESARNRARAFDIWAEKLSEVVSSFHSEIMTRPIDSGSKEELRNSEKEIARFGTLIELMLSPSDPKQSKVIDLMYKIYSEKNDFAKRQSDGDAMLALVRDIVHERRRKAFLLF